MSSRRAWGLTLMLLGGLVPAAAAQPSAGKAVDWCPSPVAEPAPPPPPDARGRKTITGAGAHFSWLVFDHLKPALEERHGVRLHLYGRESMMGAGCNAGIKKAQENRPGNETFGFTCCPLTEEEVQEMGLTVYPLAQEPLLILVNRSNPVDDISLADVRAIFRGDIRNWKAVGGEDRPIVLVFRAHCPERPGHWKTILPTLDALRKDRFSVRTEAEVVMRVSDFSEGIGNIGATWEFGPQDRVKVVKIDGVRPSAAALKAGRYPFHQQLSAITHGPVSPELDALLRDAQTSAEFMEVARKYELVPLNAGQ